MSETSEVDRLTEAVDALREAVEADKAENTRRIGLGKKLLAVAIVLATVALVVGLLVRDAFYDFLHDRDQRSMTACEDDNFARQAVQDSALALATPEALQRAEEEGGARLQQALDYLRSLRPQRVCTIEGVRAYYDSGRVEGVLPLDAPQYVLDFLERHRGEQ